MSYFLDTLLRLVINFLLATFTPPSPWTSSVIIKEILFSLTILWIVSISGSLFVMQNFIVFVGNSGKLVFCTSLLNVKESAPKVLPWNAFMQEIPGNGPFLLYAILIAFSTASAPLFMKKSFELELLIESNFSASWQCSSQ